jgi:hypothetical protein
VAVYGFKGERRKLLDVGNLREIDERRKSGQAAVLI